MKNYECRICSAKKIIDQGHIEGYVKGNFFKVLTCLNCNVSYVDPMLSEPMLYEKIYQNVQEVPGYVRYYELGQEVKRLKNPLEYIKYKEDCYFGVIDFIEKNIVDAKELILEIGCGQGYLTYALNKSGFNAVGIDISAEVIVRAKDKFGDYYFCGTLDSFVRENKIKPKFVICTEVIEHLEDPVQFVADIISLIGVDGSLILTTPNKTEFDKSIWDTESPPVHLWWFSIESLQVIANRLEAQLTCVSLRDFYKRTQYRRNFSTSTKYQRLPIFNENYQLISPIKRRSPFKVFMRNSEKRLLNFIKRIFGIFEVDRGKLSIKNNHEGGFLYNSICCVLKKSNINDKS